MNENIGAVLGKAVDYKLGYNPEVLVKIDRQENRSHIGLSGNSLPFTGYDVWHCYEATFLVNGIPVNGLMKIIIPATSKYTVESKSLKLYLFGFAMSNLGIDLNSGIQEYTSTIRGDLQELLGAQIAVYFELTRDGGGHMPAYINNADDLTVFLPWEENSNDLRYTESPFLLELEEGTYGSIRGTARYKYDGLRSNCRVTNQPDYGTIYIEYSGKRTLLPTSLAKYLVSFRNENHFHEEIVETVYARLLEKLQPDYLNVTAFYTRRGGIDICPSRTLNDANCFNSTLLCPTFFGKEVRS